MSFSSLYSGVYDYNETSVQAIEFLKQLPNKSAFINPLLSTICTQIDTCLGQSFNYIYEDPTNIDVVIDNTKRLVTIAYKISKKDFILFLSNLTDVKDTTIAMAQQTPSDINLQKFWEFSAFMVSDEWEVQQQYNSGCQILNFTPQRCTRSQEYSNPWNIADNEVQIQLKLRDQIQLDAQSIFEYLTENRPRVRNSIVRIKNAGDQDWLTIQNPALHLLPQLDQDQLNELLQQIGPEDIKDNGLLSGIKFQVEGQLEFTVTLLIPKDFERMEKSYMKMYHRNSQVVQESEFLLPKPLRCFVGIAEISDLPIDFDFTVNSPFYRIVGRHILRKAIQIIEKLKPKGNNEISPQILLQDQLKQAFLVSKDGFRFENILQFRVIDKGQQQERYLKWEKIPFAEYQSESYYIIDSKGAEEEKDEKSGNDSNKDQEERKLGEGQQGSQEIQELADELLDRGYALIRVKDDIEAKALRKYSIDLKKMNCLGLDSNNIRKHINRLEFKNMKIIEFKPLIDRIKVISLVNGKIEPCELTSICCAVIGDGNKDENKTFMINPRNILAIQGLKEVNEQNSNINSKSVNKENKEGSSLKSLICLYIWKSQYAHKHVLKPKYHNPKYQLKDNQKIEYQSRLKIEKCLKKELIKKKTEGVMVQHFRIKEFLTLQRKKPLVFANPRSNRPQRKKGNKVILFSGMGLVIGLIFHYLMKKYSL